MQVDNGRYQWRHPENLMRLAGTRSRLQGNGIMRTTRYALLGAAVMSLAVNRGALATEFSIDWYTVDGGGGYSSGPFFELEGTIGQPDTGPLINNAFELYGGFWNVCMPKVSPCTTHRDCADLDGNGIRDNACLFWSCDAGVCVETAIVFADMGGQFGECPVDGTADGNDRFHALNCFANTDPGSDGPYLCEGAAPAAFNVDAGGQFGSCAPDGVCDGNDAFHALNAFGGSTTCSCPLDGAPMPETHAGAHGAIEIVDRVTLELIAGPRSGKLINIDLFLTGGVSDLRGYQLHPAASPELTLVDMFVDPRPDHAFAGQAWWDAYNLETGQMVIGIDAEGISAKGDVYLATLVYEVTDADHSLIVDLFHDASDHRHRSFLFGTPANRKIEIIRTVPAIIGATGKQTDDHTRGTVIHPAADRHR